MNLRWKTEMTRVGIRLNFLSFPFFKSIEPFAKLNKMSTKYSVRCNLTKIFICQLDTAIKTLFLPAISYFYSKIEIETGCCRLITY